ncbi:pre-mRNA cleavage complex 2 protein Pcf11-like [Limulus polyphemus]|uniref:Pre-mRNA cleavage complex 2 protein Pcf11-like n=1 Tax=Limulus polyphemus TaxID=6850 RepID=A0ABM1C5J5_LIMPO|nr:pre-mRNA cleavage complex 2 protein Pcf11-like [Limulus polyphemus]
MDEDICEDYRSSLADLTCNSKPLINMLTMLAEDNSKYAHKIVRVIELHLHEVLPETKLPVLYLIDSIMKNVGGDYLPLFTQNIVSDFCGVFEKGDEKTRVQLFKLRQTWSDILPNKKLYAIDVRIKQLDPAWPITAQPEPSIHVNPKFLENKQKTPKEEQNPQNVQQQLLLKQQELVRLQKEKLKLEFMQAKSKLEQQKRIHPPATSLPTQNVAQVFSQRISTQLQPPVTASVNIHPISSTMALTSSISSVDPRLSIRDPRLKRDPRSNSVTSPASSSTQAAVDPISINRSSEVVVSTVPSLVIVPSTTSLPKNYDVSSVRSNSKSVEKLPTKPVNIDSDMLSTSTSERTKATISVTDAKTVFEAIKPLSSKHLQSTEKKLFFSPSKKEPTPQQLKLTEERTTKGNQTKSPTSESKSKLGKDSKEKVHNKQQISDSKSEKATNDRKISSNETSKTSKINQNKKNIQKQGKDKLSIENRTRDKTGHKERPKSVEKEKKKDSVEHSSNVQRRNVKNKESISPKKEDSKVRDLDSRIENKVAKDDSKKPTKKGRVSTNRDRSRSPLAKKNGRKMVSQNSVKGKAKEKNQVSKNQEVHNKEKEKEDKFPAKDVDLRVFTTIPKKTSLKINNSDEKDKDLRDTEKKSSENTTEDSKENTEEPPVKKKKMEESKRFFGKKDQDYRQFPMGQLLPPKSPAQQGWAQFKASHPDEYKIPLRPARENMDGPFQLGTKDQDLRQEFPGEKVNRPSLLGKGPSIERGSQDTNLRRYDRLGRPLLSRLHINPYSYRKGFSSRHGYTSLRDQQHIQVMIEKQKEIIQEIEDQLKSGRLTAEQHKEFVQQLHKLYEVQRSHAGQWHSSGLSKPEDLLQEQDGYLSRLRLDSSFNKKPNHVTTWLIEDQMNLENEVRSKAGGTNDERSLVQKKVKAESLHQDLILPDKGPIQLNGEVKQIYYFGNKAVVMVNRGDPREIAFTGSPVPVFINDKDPITLHFENEMKEFELDGKKHTIKFGLPAREIYIDGKPYEARFDGPPIDVPLDGSLCKIRLGGPPPTIVVGEEPQYQILDYLEAVDEAKKKQLRKPPDISENFLDVKLNEEAEVEVKDSPMDVDLRGGGHSGGLSPKQRGNDEQKKSGLDSSKENVSNEEKNIFNEGIDRKNTLDLFSNLKDVDMRKVSGPVKKESVADDLDQESPDETINSKSHHSLLPLSNKNIGQDLLLDRTLEWREHIPPSERFSHILKDRHRDSPPRIVKGSPWNSPAHMEGSVGSPLYHDASEQRPSRTLSPRRMEPMDWKNNEQSHGIPQGQNRVSPHNCPDMWEDGTEPRARWKDEDRWICEPPDWPRDQSGKALLRPPDMTPHPGVGRGHLHPREFDKEEWGPERELSQQHIAQRPSFRPRRNSPSHFEEYPEYHLQPPQCAVRQRLPPPGVHPREQHVRPFHGPPEARPRFPHFARDPRGPYPRGPFIPNFRLRGPAGPRFSGIHRGPPPPRERGSGMLNPVQPTGPRVQKALLPAPVSAGPPSSVTTPSQRESLPVTASQPMTSQAPMFVETPTVPAPLDIDVNTLFTKLVLAGIIAEVSQPTAQATSKEEPPSVENKEEEDKKENKINQEEEKIPPIELKADSLKIHYPGVISSLHKGTQCASCGLRFTEDQHDKYSRHLDWHFRVNRREKDGVKKAFSRKWFYDVEDWIQFEEIADLEEGARSFFEQQTDEEIYQTNELSELPSVIASANEAENSCFVCNEAFQLFWVEEDEEWHLRDAIRVDEKVYHPLCYEDFKKTSEVPETPTESQAPCLLKSEDSSETEVIVKTEPVTVEEEEPKITEDVKVKEEPIDTEEINAVTEEEGNKVVSDSKPKEETIPEEDEKPKEVLDPNDPEAKLESIIARVEQEQTRDIQMKVEETIVESEQPKPESKMVVLQSGSIVVKVKAESIAQPSPPPVNNEATATKSESEEPQSDDEFHPPPPDPRFTVLPPVLRGTELSGLCSIM